MLLLFAATVSIDAPEGASPAPTDQDIRAFAAEHHPELDRLLKELERQPDEYRSAIRDLDRQRQRILRFRERNPERYRRELERWKLDSRIQVAAIRLAALPEADTRREAATERLRELLRQKAERQRVDLLARKAELENEIERVDRAIVQFEGSEPAFVDRELRRLTRAAEAAANRSKSRKKQPSKRVKQPDADPTEKTEPASASRRSAVTPSEQRSATQKSTKRPED